MHKVHRVLEGAVERLALAAAAFAALILMAMVGLIVVEIVLRSAFATSTHVTEEFVAYGMASVVFLAFAHALRAGALIRVDLVIVRLPHRVRIATEIATVITALATVLFLARFVWASFARYWRTGAVSWSSAEVPLWIPQLVVFVGIAIFGLQLVVYLLRLLTGGAPLQDKASVE